VTLLLRSNQGVSLTLAGKLFLTRARSIILDCDRAVQDVRQWDEMSERQIALGVAAKSLAACLMPVFSSFIRRFPNVQLHVAGGKTKMLIEMIRAGRLDFVMCPLGPNVCDTDLHIERLYSSTASIIARKGHPLANARSVADLVDCQWISVRPAGVAGSAETSCRLAGRHREQALLLPGFPTAVHPMHFHMMEIALLPSHLAG